MTRLNELIVHAVDVHKSFGRIEVLKGVSLDVHRGEVGVPDRPVGLGEDDLPALHQPPRDDRLGGRIEVNGHLIGYRQGKNGELRADSERNVARHRIEIGFVFQRFNLWPHMTVLQNIIEAPMRVRGISRDEAVADAERLLGRVAPLGEARRVSRAPLRRPAAASRDRPRARDEPRADAVRRAHQRARSRDRSARC